MKSKNQKPYLEISLCPRCASIYYNDKKYYIKRVDRTQTIYEECITCQNPRGYDFNIWLKSTLQNKESHHCGGDRK